MTTKKTGALVWKILISVLLILALLLVVGEFGLRSMISKQMKEDFSTSASSEEPSIEFGPTPILLSQLTGVIPSVDLDVPSTVAISEGEDGAAKVTGTPATKIAIQDLNIKDQDNPIAGHLNVETSLPEDYLLAQAQAATAEQQQQSKDDFAAQLIAGLVKVTNIDTMAADQTVKVEFSGGVASLTLKPKTDNGQLTFTADNANLLGIDMPSGVTEAITESFEKGAGEMSGGLSIDDIAVTDSSVDLKFSGENVPLQEIGDSTGGSGAQEPGRKA